MDKQFLIDYGDHENELAIDYFKINSPKLKDIQYPPIERFPKLKNPYTYAVIGKQAPLWPQILCTGSLIVPLLPQKDEKQFKENYGFSKGMIDDIIQFSKDTGRIHFILECPPQEFQNLPFLEPIFSELRPPILIDSRTTMSKKRYEALVEIRAITDLFDRAFSTIWNEFQKSDTISQERFNENLYTRTYADLRDAEFNEIADEIINNILIDPYRACALLDVSEIFITGPLWDPFHAQMSTNYERAVSAKELIGAHFDVSKTNIFPSEIGAFLFKKEVLNPKSFESSQLALEIYSDNQFYQVYQAFNDAISNKDYSILDKKMKNLDEIFTQIWDDAESIRRRKDLIAKPIDFVNVGIGLSISELASRGVTTLNIGFLFGLGYLAAVTIAGDYLKNDIPEYLSRLIEKPYNVTIYDFKHNMK